MIEAPTLCSTFSSNPERNGTPSWPSRPSWKVIRPPRLPHRDPPRHVPPVGPVVLAEAANEPRLLRPRDVHGINDPGDGEPAQQGQAGREQRLPEQGEQRPGHHRVADVTVDAPDDEPLRRGPPGGGPPTHPPRKPNPGGEPKPPPGARDAPPGRGERPSCGEGPAHPQA